MSEQKEQGLVERHIELAKQEVAANADIATAVAATLLDALEAQAAENAELRAEVERKTRRADMIEKSAGFATDEVARLEDENKALKARALAAETALATAREDALEEAKALADRYAVEPDPDEDDPYDDYGMGSRSTARCISRDLAALKTKEPSHG